MSFLVNYATSVGTKKAVNQDALCIKRAKIVEKEYLLVVICDGMGGLASGELASGTVVRYLSEWFTNEFIRIATTISGEQIKEIWKDKIYQLNQKLWDYGKENHTQLGTTLTAILFLPNNNYIIGHVGDTRLYKIDRNLVEQITEDQTFIAREIKRGNMTPEQAANDPRRNVLLQCIGASNSVEEIFYDGTFTSGDYYLLCSDGFRHVLSEKEMQEAVIKSSLNTELDIADCLSNLIRINESRGEQDNITAVLVKIV